MLLKIKKLVKKVLFPEKREISVKWIQKDSNAWLVQQFKDAVIKPSQNAFSKKIEHLSADTNKQGPQPLWEGYKTGDPTNDRGPTRKANDVRTASTVGDLYAEIIVKRKPELVNIKSKESKRKNIQKNHSGCKRHSNNRLKKKKKNVGLD